MPLHSGFGLTLDVSADLDLSELPRVTAPAGPVLSVVRDTVTKEPGERLVASPREGLASEWIDRLPGGTYRLGSLEYGDFEVDIEGAVIRCEPREGRLDWEAMLTGQVLPLASTLLGFEAFHAAAVVLTDRAIAFSAPSGTGKTSVVAHLVAGGAALLADDVTALSMTASGVAVAHSGGGRLHLDPSEAERVLAVAEVGRLARAGTRDDKDVVVASLEAKTAALQAFCFLERASEGTPQIVEVSNPSPTQLLGATFNLAVRSRERLSQHFELCHTLATNVRIVRVAVTPDVDAASLAGAVRAWFEVR